MPVFAEDPTQLSRERLKSDLIAHSVTLPPATSKKEIYVELHAKHVQRKSADFSSDEEPEAEEGPNDAETLDPSSLTDDGLKAALLQRGVKAGPIVASTRGLYERKLRSLLLSNGHNEENDEEEGADEAVLYSDSEEEENSEEEWDEPATEEVQTQTEPADQSRQRFCTPKNAKPRPKRNPRNMFKSSQLGRAQSGVSRASSIDQPTGLATGRSSEQQPALTSGSLEPQTFSITQLVAETPFEDENKSHDLQFYTPVAERTKVPAPDPVEERFKDLLADTPTGIYASRRRPIKGAAARPVQYIYPDATLSLASPLSPTSVERQEVERQLVSLRIQLLVFLIVAIILYVVYGCVEDFNPASALISVFHQGLDADEANTQEVEEFLEVE